MDLRQQEQQTDLQESIFSKKKKQRKHLALMPLRRRLCRCRFAPKVPLSAFPSLRSPLPLSLSVKPEHFSGAWLNPTRKVARDSPAHSFILKTAIALASSGKQTPSTIRNTSTAVPQKFLCWLWFFFFLARDR